MPRSAEIKKYGDRNDVWHGRALMTKGGLRFGDLAKSKSGKIVSRIKQAIGEQRYIQYGLARFKAPAFTSKRR